MLDIQKGYGGNSSACYADTVDYDKDSIVAPLPALFVPGVWVDGPGGNYTLAAANGTQTAVQIWEGHEHGITSGKLTVLKGNYRAATDKVDLGANINAGDPLTINADGHLIEAGGGHVVVATCIENWTAPAAPGDSYDPIVFEACAPGSRRTA